MKKNKYFDYKNIITELICSGVDTAQLDKEEIYNLLEYPPDENLGDLAFPCFKLSKLFKRSPAAIAEDLKGKIPSSPYIKQIVATGPYLNFWFTPEKLVENVLQQVLSSGERFGAQNIGNGRNIVIDFSAPNIAKPFHVGHLSSTVIGNSLYKIFEFLGFNCIGINHLGDWGTQFGKLITAYKKWGSREAVEKGLIQELMRLYVKFHEEAEKDPTLEDEAREWFNKIEKGNQEALELWKWFKEISLEEFQRVYEVLDIKFDSLAGESFYNDKIDAVVQELKAKNLLQESEGALIINLDHYDMPPCLILKKDGSSLYATRDIAAALYRKKTYDFAQCLYVTGIAQSLHFQQWFKVIELMGYEWSKDLVHIPFGWVNLEGEKLSTRKGKVVLLEELLRETVNRTLEIIKEKNPNLEEKEEIAKEVGVGAVVFGALSVNRIKDVTFSWADALNFDGETGPYIQYTHARACSILRKAGFKPDSAFDSHQLCNKEAIRLIKTLYLFPEKIIAAMKEYEPSVISRYLVVLAQQFNAFYHECQVLVDDEVLQKARLVLVYAVKTILATGLRLLGIKAPERM